MSWDALKAVKDHQFGSASAKAVMLVLASYTDAEWSAFAGQELIADETELSVRTVRDVMKDLEGRGLLVRQRRHRRDGSRTSDRLLLVESAIMSLPANGAGREQPATGAEPTGKSRQSLPATGAEPTGNSRRGIIEEVIEEHPEEDIADASVGAAIEPVAAVETLPERARRRDDVFEAVATVCFGDDWQTGLTPTARGPLNRAVKELKAVGASPGDVVARAEAYVRWLGQRPTPPALVKHWPRLADPIQRLPRQELEVMAEEQVLEVRMAEAERRERQRLAEEAARAAQVVPILQLGPDPAVSPSLRYPRRPGESVREYVARVGRISAGAERPGDRDEEAG